MKQIDEKSMKTLEYYKIIDQLSEFTVSDLGRKEAKNIRPFKRDTQVVHALEETDDAVNVYGRKGGIPLGAFYDVRPHLKRMEIDAVLAGQELMQIGQRYKGVRELCNLYV